MDNFAHNTRKTLLIVVMTIVIWLSFQFIAPVYAAQTPAPQQAILVKFAPDVDKAERDALVSAMGGQIDLWMGQISTARVLLPTPSTRSLNDAFLIAKTSPEVLSSELDGQVTGSPIIEKLVGADAASVQSTIPASPVQVNDPDYNNAQRVYAPQKIQVPLAWRYSMGSGDIVVAVIDSGIDSSHPDLKDNVLAEKGYDFVNNDADPSDDHGHGTHIAGIIAAVANNNMGTAGICPNCSLLPIKVLDRNNVGTWSNVAAGILYAVDNGARVINLSLGGSSNTQVVADAVNYAVEHNVVVVAAAGNGRTDKPFYPAALENVIGVSATRNDDTRWSLSNYGQANTDVAAPGYAIYSTYNDLNNFYGGYIFMSGTSMAAPHVAGLAGLLLSQDPARTVDEIRNLILSTADDLGDPGWDIYFGHGRINAYKALQVGVPRPQADASMGGMVWLDTNANGQWEPEERAGVSKVTIRLLDQQNAVITQTTPGETGHWQIEGLYPGSYSVEAIASGDVVLTSNSRYSVQLESGQARSDLNFGAATLSDLNLQYQAYVPYVLN